MTKKRPNLMTNTLEKNLARLGKINAKLAFQLRLLDSDNVQFCETKQGELNLKRVYQGQTYYYHSQEGARKDAEQWFESLDLNEISILYVYGIGLGYYAEAAQNWLKEDSKRALVFLEKDPSILYRLFETDKGTWLLDHPQIKVYYFTDTLTDKTLFNELSWTYINCPFTVSSLNLYATLDADEVIQLRHQITHDAIEKKDVVSEYLHYGVAFFRNFYPNMLELPESFLGNGLFNGFSNIPAIICGAGPSLSRNIDLLKTLTDQALIFAGGSALNAIIPSGILPHFGAAIDPNQAQYSRVKVAQPYKIPFFYRARLFHDALKAISGPRLYLTGAGGYDTAEWFENQLGIEGEPLDEGNNVVNFCIEIAHALGCSPIILVGVDLAYTNDQYYASTVVENLNLTAKDFEGMKEFDAEPIVRNDIYGQPIKTVWKWVTESEWISEFAHSHPETMLINATEGGLGMPDVPNTPLSEVAKTYLKPIPSLQQKIQEHIQYHSLSKVTRDSIVSHLGQLKESLARCIDKFLKIMQEMEELKSFIQTNKPYPELLQTPAIALTEMEIEEEAGYQAVLNTFNLIYIHIHNRDIAELQSPHPALSKKQIDLQKIDLQIKRLTFLKDVARINIELIDRAI